MRLIVRFEKVEPHVYQLPETCSYVCGGEHFRPYGLKGERKALRDIGYDEVISYRHECVRCRRTFRVYPYGMSKGAQQSERLRAMTVLLYVLGLSYGAVEQILDTAIPNMAGSQGRDLRLRPDYAALDPQSRGL